MLINYYDFMTIRLLLPFLCLECKGFNPKTTFPQQTVVALGVVEDVSLRQRIASVLDGV